MFGSRPKTLALTPRFFDVGGGGQPSSNQNQPLLHRRHIDKCDRSTYGANAALGNPLSQNRPVQRLDNTIVFLLLYPLDLKMSI